ncbi:MAG: RNA-directed DNA polymerase [Actinophytocola sp.]|uniref:RNA-directed DNA polymerase n=1 Tax=Actinophytocola sp. TaxID=1872138 RepID=UPI003D6AA7AC
MDWLNALDFEQALSNVRKDLVGDWYKDPWNWPEYDSLSQDDWSILVRRARAEGVRRVSQIDVPKENFAIRPAMIMEAVDRVLYQALADRQSKSLIGSLNTWVFGWRLPRSEPSAGRYSPNRTEWGLYRSALSDFVIFNDVGLKTDIVSCFASISIERVIEDIERVAGGNEVTGRLSDMLEAFDGIPGRRGLPQRSKASATLANMYLQRIDRVLREHELTHPSTGMFSVLSASGGVTRWMDDLWIFGSDHGDLRSVQLDVQKAARDAGLEMNMGKTEVLDGEELQNVALSIQHSAVDDALDDDDPDFAPLEELIDKIVADPERADRTSIHFALTRMRDQKLVTRQEELIETAHRMPHAADHLARAFRDLKLWRELQDWYLEYYRGPWSIEWSVASLGAMFPSRGGVRDDIHEAMADFLMSGPSLPLFALAAQRLASWDAEKAREVIRAVLPHADHPHERRVLGLAALLASDERQFIREILREYEENAVTLRVIERRKFRPIKPAPDFGADTIRE